MITRPKKFRRVSTRHTAARSRVKRLRRSSNSTLRRALSCVKNAHASLQFGMTPDVVLTDAEGALEALGELSGKHIREDLVDTIFSRFCVGK